MRKVLVYVRVRLRVYACVRKPNNNKRVDKQYFTAIILRIVYQLTW
jgi:hypothetical protein